MLQNRPLVGVGVLVTKGNNILFGYRTASHGAQCWSPPGGHLELGETIEACAKRELLEETGLRATEIEIVGVTDDFFHPENKHYVTIMTRAYIIDDEPRIMEPEKISAWQWFDWHELPKDLFLPLINFIKLGMSPFDAFLQSGNYKKEMQK